MFICLVYFFFFFFFLIRKMIRSVTLIRGTIRTVSFLIRCTPSERVRQSAGGREKEERAVGVKGRKKR